MGVGFVALGPGRFYGGGLPRPRYFSDVKLNAERVDPPTSVLDPLLSWANEAHWSMGGLGFQRYRLQGRIEGSIKKLRAQQHDQFDRKKAAAAAAAMVRMSAVKSPLLKSLDLPSSGEIVEETAAVVQPIPPKKKRARKLIDEFEKVAVEEKTQTRRAFMNHAVHQDSPKKKVKKVDGVDLASSRICTKGEVSAAVASPVSRRASPRNALAKAPFGAADFPLRKSARRRP